MRSGTGNTAEFKEDNMSIHVVVMGVAGCGKSTVAEAIHERLGYVYAEGDDFHPQANIDKMSAGIPLTDEDRWPWLKVINTWMVAREALDENTVVSSSALKRSYREVLAQNVPTFFVHLTGSQELIQQRLNELLFANPQRINYYERYQQIIDDYNSEQNRATIEKTFMDLMDLANSMDQEEQRYVREGFSSDEELSLYDLLFSENLSKQDIQKIKHVAVDLLAKVKAKIAELDHWTDKQETKAAVDNLIRDTLWAELPECYDEISISGYRQKIYEYVYTRYPDVA